MRKPAELEARARGRDASFLVFYARSQSYFRRLGAARISGRATRLRGRARSHSIIQYFGIARAPRHTSVDVNRRGHDKVRPERALGLEHTVHL